MLIHVDYLHCVTYLGSNLEILHCSHTLFVVFPAPSDATSSKTRPALSNVFFFVNLRDQCGLIHQSASRRRVNFKYAGNKMRLMRR